VSLVESSVMHDLTSAFSILQVGPTFNIDGQATLDLDADINMKLGINYDIKNGAFAFPPNDKLKPAGDPVPTDSSSCSSPLFTNDGELTSVA
jgi:hypothetical protein